VSRLLLPALVALALLAAGPASAQMDKRPGERRGEWSGDRDEERESKEIELKLPAYPKAEDLIEFPVSGGTNFRFFIDPASLAVESDGVVRYTLVARSPGGISNISYEGIRCSTNVYKVFALGNDGRWSVKPSDWREINAKSVQRWHGELRSYFFCPHGRTIASGEEGLNALRRGRHPDAATVDGAR